jgi:hypothetical protein
MSEQECLDQEDLMMSKGIVSMYRSIWSEVERQFPSLSVEDRFKMCSLIAPLINNMIFTAFTENSVEDSDKNSGKRKKR